MAKRVRVFTEEEKVYEELRKAMNNAPLRAPRTPSLMKMLKFFFPTIDDAIVATRLECVLLGGKGKTAEEIGEETGKDPGQVRDLLDAQFLRGAIIKFQRADEPGVMEYSHAGPWSMSDLLGTLGKDDSQDPNGVTYRQVINKYYEEGYLLEWGSSNYPAFRALVVDKQVDPGSAVLAFEQASQIIKAQEKIAIGWCNCRVRHRHCDHRIDCCFCFGGIADNVVEMSRNVPGARPVNYVTQEEALKILEECFAEGLVACTTNNSDPTQNWWICMCCECCCHILGGYARNLTGWGNPKHLAKSNFLPQRDNDKCNLCEKCIKLCPVKAYWRHWPHRDDLSDDYVFLEEARCIGCGICAYNCPEKAITMIRNNDDVPEPDNVALFNRYIKEGRHE